MKQIRKKITVLLPFILACQISLCQTDVLSDLRSGFSRYNEDFPAEKIYVHTDKSFYTAGEIVWFKMYDLLKARLSKVAYVEILDDHNTVAAHAKIGLDDNGGSGSILLPLTLNSGYYTFRAYTNWMKNSGAEHFFQKKITIVNPLKTLAVDESNKSLARLELFPEGGNLVSGIPSTLAFAVTGPDGKGANGTGYLLDEKNDTVTSFTPFRFGLGSLQFTPQAERSYKAVFVFDDNSIIAQTLPRIYNNGYVMHVEDQGQTIRVLIQTNVSSGYPELYLVSQNHGIISAAKRNVVSNGSAVFVLDKSELGQGVSQITVFNNQKQPVCERLFFVVPSRTRFLNVATGKTEYNNREEVILYASSAGAGAANLSLSVYQLDSLQTKEASDVYSYLWLESELNGRIEDPQYYLSGNTDEIRKAADLLILTHGWRRFNWEQVLNEKPAIRFLPELAGQIITGKITDLNNQPLKGVQLFLSIPETSYKLYSGISNDAGIVPISVKDFYGNSELVLQTNTPGAAYRVTVTSPYSDQYAVNKYPAFSLSPGLKSVLEDHSIGMQASHIYRADSIQQFDAPDIRDTFPFFGRPLYSYKLDNYTRFTTMEEVLREYVREVNVGVKGSGDLKFKLFNENNRDFFVDDILVVVDGVPQFNTSKIFSMDPLKIRKLDIITRNYVLGSSVFRGLASFSTYSGNHEGIDIDPKAVTVDYEGLQMQREFYSPEYSTEQQRRSRIPDFRTTLFWAPNIQLDQKVKFFTGDSKGRYLIVVQGISREGEPLTAVSEIEVK